MTTCTAPFPVRITASAPSGKIIHVRAVTVSARKRAVMIRHDVKAAIAPVPSLFSDMPNPTPIAYKPGLRILVRFQIRVYQ